MADHTTIHEGTPTGTHPSSHNPGVHTFHCDGCGREVRYADQLGEDYVWHDGDKVGYHDIGTSDDLCPKCEKEIYGEDDAA